MSASGFKCTFALSPQHHPRCDAERGARDPAPLHHRPSGQRPNELRAGQPDEGGVVEPSRSNGRWTRAASRAVPAQEDPSAGSAAAASPSCPTSAPAPRPPATDSTLAPSFPHETDADSSISPATSSAHPSPTTGSSSDPTAGAFSSASHGVTAPPASSSPSSNSQRSWPHSSPGPASTTPTSTGTEAQRHAHATAEKARGALKVRRRLRRRTTRLPGSDWCPWAELLEYVFAVDGLRCPHCGRPMKLRAVVHRAHEARKIVADLRRSARPPPGAARPPTP
jgi:hypothetical protein